MLNVPKIKQPDATSCLPTCVLAVVRFLGYEISFDVVWQWCHATRIGSDADLAAQGLIESGIDARVEQSNLDELAELIDNGQPPIIIIHEGSGWYHAVMVCSVNADSVVVMDPRMGDYHALTLDNLEQVWLPGHSDLVQIGGSPEATKSSRP